MLCLGVFSSKTSPPEDPPPTFITVTNEPAASGNTTSGRTRYKSTTLATLMSPAVYSSIMLGIYTPTQPERLPETEVQYPTVTLRETPSKTSVPPMWASDDVRGIRKRFRG
jgi:hypothetical protein